MGWGCGGGGVGGGGGVVEEPAVEPVVDPELFYYTNDPLCFANLFLETPSSINEIKKINKIIARIVNAVTQHISIITASAASARQQQ